jgi:acyl carrier protein
VCRLSNNNVGLRLSDVFMRVFGLKKIELRDQMSAKDIEGWDSLTHINLIVAVEREFRIKLTTAEVSGLNNVGDLMQLINRKLPSSRAAVQV